MIGVPGESPLGIHEVGPGGFGVSESCMLLDGAVAEVLRPKPFDEALNTLARRQMRTIETSETHTPGPTPLAAVASVVRHANRYPGSYAATIVLGSESQKLAFMGQVADCLAQAAPPTDQSPQPRLLYVVPSAASEKDLAIGPQATLLSRLYPSLQLGRPHHYHYSAPEPPNVVIVNEQKLQDALRHPRMPVEEIGMVMYDSGANPPDPQTLATLHDVFPTTGCLNLVTSPVSGTFADKHEGLPLPVLHENSLVQAIQQGSVNGVQLFSLRTPLQQQPEAPRGKGEAALQYEDNYNSQVVDAVVELVECGRRVAVYCQSGRESAHAQKIIRMLREREVAAAIDPNTCFLTCRPVTAELLSAKYNSTTENSRIITDFNRGEIDVVAGTSGLEENGGIFADAFVIANRAERKLLEKILASAAIPNPRFPTTVVVEIVPLIAAARHRSALMCELLGRDTVQQSVVIGGYIDPRQPKPQHSPEPFDLPPSLQPLAAAVDSYRTASFTLAYAPERSLRAQVPFSDLRAECPEHSERVVRDYLRANGFKTNVRFLRGKSQQTTILEYDSSAQDFLREHPLPPLPRSGEMTGSQIAALFSADNGRVYIQLRKYGDRLQYTQRYSAKGGRGGYGANYLTADSARLFITETFNPPEADASDTALATLDEHLGCGPAFIQHTLETNDLSAVPKWARPPQVGCYLFADADTGHHIVQAYLQLPEAEPTDVAITRYAPNYRASVKTLLHGPLAPFAADIQFKRVPGGTLALPFVSRDASLTIDAALGYTPKQPAAADAEEVEPEGESEPVYPEGWGSVPGVTVGRTVYKSMARLGAAVSNSAFKDPVPEELMAKAPTTDRHHPEVPGSWVPKARAAGHFISLTEKLSVEDIAARLDITEADVTDALARVGFVEPPGPILSGRALLLLRQQLIGVPLEYLRSVSGLPPVKITTALQAAGYHPTEEGYYSPGAADYLQQHADSLRD